jgi:hypothetical protein
VVLGDLEASVVRVGLLRMAGRAALRVEDRAMIIGGREALPAEAVKPIGT